MLHFGNSVLEGYQEDYDGASQKKKQEKFQLELIAILSLQNRIGLIQNPCDKTIIPRTR